MGPNNPITRRRAHKRLLRLFPRQRCKDDAINLLDPHKVLRVRLLLLLYDKGLSSCPNNSRYGLFSTPGKVEDRARRA